MVAAIVAVAIIADTCEGFVFVAMPTPEGQLVRVFVFVFHILYLLTAFSIPHWVGHLQSYLLNSLNLSNRPSIG